MLTFLTLDVNQDGIISEDDLMFLTNMYKVDFPVLEDIYSIVEYCKKNKNLNCEVDLPLEYIKAPTIKEYRKISNTYEHKVSDSRLGVFRLFSLKEDDEDEDNNRKKVSLNEKEVNNMKTKRIKLNFGEFQRLFTNKKTAFVNDLFKFLTSSEV